MHQRYAGQTAAFLTQHGKEALVAPVLEPFLGCRIQRVDGYDTDQLGSFSGEVKRVENQIETARKKARIGIELSGLSVGLASEGAFMPDPVSGLIPWNIEVVVWLDTQSSFEVIGIAQGPTLSMHQSIRNLTDLRAFAQRADFPNHQLIMRPESETDLRIYKGISNWEQLEQTFINCQNQSSQGWVYVEHDHRAFCHPTRQGMIKNAVDDLVKKFKSICPQCHTPGFAASSHRAGLPCRACGHPTHIPLGYTFSCQTCHFSEEKLSDEKFADPSRCDVCNP